MIRKYYEYEGLGGGIDPKSTSKAKTMTQSMTKPFIVANVREITDLWDKEEISYSRMVEMLNEIAAEFYKPKIDIMTQTMTKEQILEKQKANSEYPTYYHESNVLDAMEHYKEQEVAKEREKAKKLVEALDIIYKNTGDKLIYDIAKQSLTEYEKL